MGFNLDDYEPVEVRLRKFWEEHPKGRVDTYVDVRDDVAIARCTLYAGPDDSSGKIHPRSSGWASNKLGQTGRTAQATHPIEDAETSAIGRALANWKYASEDKPRASREEMRTVPSTPVNLLHLVQGMNEEEREKFKVALFDRWPGIGLVEVPADLAEDVCQLALDCVADRYAEPEVGSEALTQAIKDKVASDLEDFGEEPF